MPSTILNEATTTYQLGGSPEIRLATSNTNEVILRDNTGLVLSKTGTPTTFLAGDIITYTINITNASGNYLNGVRIIDNLGGGNLAYVVGSASLTVGNLTYPVSPVATNPLTFTLQQLNVGQSMTLRYQMQVIFNLPQSVNSITNSVRGIGYTSTGTIEGYDSFTIQKKTDGDISINKTASVTDTLPNEDISYYIRVTNNALEEARILSVVDQLPTNFVVTSVQLEEFGSVITLDPSDYTISSGNMLTLPSATGPVILLPPASSIAVIVNGYFN